MNSGIERLYQNKVEVLQRDLEIKESELEHITGKLIDSRVYATEQSNKLCASLGFNVLQSLAIIVLLFNIFS